MIRPRRPLQRDTSLSLHLPFPLREQTLFHTAQQRDPEAYQTGGAIEKALINRLRDLTCHYASDRARCTQQAHGTMGIAREMAEAVFPTLQQLAPPSMLASGPSYASSERGRQTVKEYLFPHRIKLELVTKESRLEVIEGHYLNRERPCCVVPWSDMRELGFEPGSVTTFPTAQVLLGTRLMKGHVPSAAFEVSVPGVEETLVAKNGCPLGFPLEPLLTEMEIYGKLRELRLDSEVRVPGFRGLITYGAGVVDLLIAKIPTKYPSLLPIITGHLVEERPELGSRQRWASQIEHTVSELHRNGIVWGGAKLDNVLIDHDDNAWVLDFGRGVTDDWADGSMDEGKEGDVQALGLLKAALLEAEAVKQGGPGGGSQMRR